jgi:hypothetical protein
MKTLTFFFSAFLEHFWTASEHIYEKISSIPFDDAFAASTFLDIQQMDADKNGVALLLGKRLKTKEGMLKSGKKEGVKSKM